MSETSPVLIDALAARLLHREVELLKLLHDSARPAAGEASGPGVHDFKDDAVQEAEATVQEAAASHAALELRSVTAALRRLRNGTYGDCLRCGEPIAQARLQALPDAAFCTDCQQAEEAHAHASVRA
jgi:DnaK suppressor protein